MQKFRLLHDDDCLVAIDKPAGFHSHPPEDKSVRLAHRWNALGLLEKQLGQKLYPAHRLDRGTSGVLVFSKKQELNHALHEQFQARTTGKTYFCVVRGHLKGEADINEPLKNDAGAELEARTLVTELATFTLPIPGPKGSDRVFTLVQATPVTGRYHQIRRHLARLGLPIVGDNRHGDSRLNREFRALTGLERMLLRCMELKIQHPATGEPLRLRALWHKDWHEIFDRAGFCPWLKL
jgi:tRNA pseudouridine65 synthase